MFLERACLAGDTPSCTHLATLPVTLASASASSPPLPSIPCPSALAPVASSSSPAASAPPAIPAPIPSLDPLPSEVSRETSTLVDHCTKGEGSACTQLGIFFQKGIGAPHSPRRALQAFSLGCARSNALGCRYAGLLLQQEQPQVAISYLRRGCVGSDPASCALLGEIARKGVYPDLPPAYGIEQLRTACANAYAPACRSLAHLLREGVALPKDEDTAARMEGRSLDLTQQRCSEGILDECLLLGLWQERPGVLGELPGDTPRTTDLTSLESALTSYQKACDAGHPSGCRRAIELLDSMLQQEKATALWGRLEDLCGAGDAISCGEVLRENLHHAPSVQTLTKACELALPRACFLLGTLPGTTAVDALQRACRLEEGAGCDAYLRSLHQGDPEKLLEAQQELCAKVGGLACAKLAARTQEEGCSAQLLSRACKEAPVPTPLGCAEAAEWLRKQDPKQAATLEERACSLALEGGHPTGKAAESCGYWARSLQESNPKEARKFAEISCKAGATTGCAVLAELLEASNDEGEKKQAQEAAQRACGQGHSPSCEIAFGPLPASSPPPIQRPIVPALPVAGCNYTPIPISPIFPAIPGLLTLWAILRRRSS